MEILGIILTAVVTLITSLTSSILVFKSEQNKISMEHAKLQKEQIDKQDEKMQDLVESIRVNGILSCRLIGKNT